MGDFDIKVTRKIDARAVIVWDTLTRPDLVAKWTGAKIESDWKQGSAISWSGEYKGKAFSDNGEVLEVEPGKHLKHTHSSGAADAANENVLDWILAEDSGSTKLTLTQSGAKSQKQADEFKQNWGTMLDALKRAAEEAN